MTSVTEAAVRPPRVLARERRLFAPERPHPKPTYHVRFWTAGALLDSWAELVFMAHVAEQARRRA